jgi:UDP-N-acetylmuramoyl-L-alanyl-D-glutamate--2,6-diaminopimelate ligase
VAGKGHEQGQELKGEIKPFDDREVLGDALLNAEPAPASESRARGRT